MPLYRVTYTPAEHVEALAKKRGMKPDDDTSFWDWVSDDECEQCACQVADFATAARIAKGCVPDDVTGEVRILEVVSVHWRSSPPTWETLATWTVYDDVDPEGLSADAPDWRDELCLDEGDEVLCERRA